MNLSVVLAALALVPQPNRVVEKGGVTAEVAVREVTDKALRAEGYRLTVAADGVTIASADAAGAFYARQTLKQGVHVDGVPFGAFQRRDGGAIAVHADDDGNSLQSALPFWLLT
mgnify:CR=1 FL=1